MKYYKKNENGIITMIGSGSAIHETQTEITRAEYDALVAAFQDKPKDTLDSVYELKESGMYEPRERTKEERVAWYIETVQAGTVALEDVPEEYRAEVEAAINGQADNPYGIDEELLAQIQQDYRNQVAEEASNVNA